MPAQDNKTNLNSTPAGQQPESDAKKLAAKHLADPNHIITEEEMRSIRVGVVSAPDEPTKQAVKEGKDRIADTEATNEGELAPGAQKSTPWDVIKG